MAKFIPLCDLSPEEQEEVIKDLLPQIEEADRADEPLFGAQLSALATDEDTSSPCASVGAKRTGEAH